MRIAVISDTHDVLRPDVLALAGTTDAVIHAGDISSPVILNRLKFALRTSAFHLGEDVPLYVVRGNADKEWATNLPETLSFTLEGVNFFVIHNRKHLDSKTFDASVLDDRQIIIFGHSHQFFMEETDGRLWLNPGACGRRRFHLGLSMAILQIENGKWHVEKIELEAAKRLSILAADNDSSLAATSAKRSSGDLSSGELLGLISSILSRMERGQTVSKVARDLSLDEHFVEQICRIYVTHPGVTAGGILDKLEVNRRTGSM